MRWLFILLLLGSSALALTPGEKVLVDRLNQINIEQKGQLEDTSAKLVWTYKELEAKQPLIDQITKERDDAVNYGKSEHELRLQADKKVSDERASKIKWQVRFGILAILIAGFLAVKYGTPWGRLIL